MTKKLITADFALTFTATVLCTIYFALHFDYLEIPTEDYIGNFLPAISSLLHLDFAAYRNKILPVYPAVIALLSTLNPFRQGDHIYQTAIVFNFVLLFPYFFMTLKIYRKYLDTNTAVTALFFLALNPYTSVMMFNAELEMFMATLTVAAFFFMEKRNLLSAFFSSLLSFTKLNAVFILPSWLLYRLRNKKKIFSSFFIAGLTALPLFFWLLCMFLHKTSVSYVGEIANRGPNIYRFFIDVFFVLSGFLQWGALYIYDASFSPWFLPIALLLLVWGILTLSALVSGIVLFAGKKSPLTLPLLCYTAGYFFVHCVYQNSKDRYVFAILWILLLFCAIGFRECILPRLRKIGRSLTIASIAVIAFLLLYYLFILFTLRPLVIVSFLLFLLSFSAIFVYHLRKSSGYSGITLKNTAAFLFALVIISASCVHGNQLFDHYSLRRMQFKLAAEWLKTQAEESRKILITEHSVIGYYGGLRKHPFALTSTLKSETVDELLEEMKARNIYYILVDDFYIKRLLVKDRNAIDRNAGLLLRFREQAASIPLLRLEKEITFRNDHAYIYSLHDEK